MLEARYRTLLRLLPRGYRAEREEEMVDTFLAAMRDADPENVDLTLKHGRPSGAEMRAVLALALHTRWGETVAPERFAARALAWRMTLMTALTVTWTLSTAYLIELILQLAIQPVIDLGGMPYDVGQHLAGLHVGTWPWWQEWAYAFWVATLPLVVFGGRAGARWAAACAVPPTLVVVVDIIRRLGSEPNWADLVLTAIIPVAIVTGLIALGRTRYHGPVPGHGHAVALPRRDAAATRFLLVGAMGVGAHVAIGLAILVTQPRQYDTAAMTMLWVISFDHGWWCLAALVGAVCWAGASLSRRPVADGAVLALAWASAFALLYNAEWAAVYGVPFSRDQLSMTVALALQIAFSGAVFVISALAAARRLRVLPRGRYAAPRPVAGAGD